MYFIQKINSLSFSLHPTDICEGHSRRTGKKREAFNRQVYFIMTSVERERSVETGDESSCEGHHDDLLVLKRGKGFVQLFLMRYLDNSFSLPSSSRHRQTSLCFACPFIFPCDCSLCPVLIFSSFVVHQTTKVEAENKTRLY